MDVHIPRLTPVDLGAPLPYQPTSRLGGAHTTSSDGLAEKLQPSGEALTIFAILDEPDERGAVTLLCRELGLESLAEQALGYLVVRNLRAAAKFASVAAADAKRLNIPHVMEDSRVAEQASRQAEALALRGLIALQGAKRAPSFVNIVVAGAQR